MSCNKAIGGETEYEVVPLVILTGYPFEKSSPVYNNKIYQN